MWTQPFSYGGYYLDEMNPYLYNAPPPEMNYTDPEGQQGGGLGAAGNLLGGAAGLGTAGYLGGGIGGGSVPIAASAAAPAATAAQTGVAIDGALGAAPAAGIGALPLAGIGIGAGLIGKGLYDTYKGKKGDLLSRASAGIATGGISELARALGLFGGPKTEVEDKRYRALQDQGVSGFDRPFQATKDPHAWYRGDLAKDFIGSATDGQWVNNKFAMSRDVKDLRPEDITGYAAFGEKFGNDWLGKYSDADRKRIAQQALDKGAVKEHHGTVDIDWAKLGATDAAPKPTGQQLDPGRLIRRR